MASSEEEIKLIIRAVDQATATLHAIRDAVDQVGTNAKTTTSHVDALGQKLGSIGQALKTGFGVAIAQDVLGEFTRGFQDLVHVIPDAIAAGNEYLEQIHQIQLQTGMTAEQTSILVGVTKNLGITADQLDPLFARLGKHLSANEGLFRDLGVATRDANGNFLDSWTIIQNVREAVSQHGEALLSTAAAQDLFGRGAYQLLALLQQNDAEWKASTENIQRWGGVMSQDAINGAHRFTVEMNSLQTGILDIGTNIAAALDPFLTAFVDSFSQFVQSHLQQIIDFAVQVASAVMGILSGLFGFTTDFSKATDSVGQQIYKAADATSTFGQAAKSAKSGVDAFTTAINNQIKAIDAHIQAIQQAAEKRKAIEQEQQLRQTIANAKAQLADLQGNTPFLGGLSAQEQVLALQKHAQDIVDAKKAVGAAQQSLGDFQADQKDRAETQLLERERARAQQELSAHKAANAAILDSGLKMAAGLDSGVGKSLANIGLSAQNFAKTAASSFKAGSDAARGFIDMLLGAEHAVTIGGGLVSTSRSGGVVGALGALGDSLSGLGTVAAGAGRLIGGLNDLIGHIGDAIRPLTDALDHMWSLFVQMVGQWVRTIEWANSMAHSFGFPGIPGLATGGTIPPGGTAIINEQGREQVFAGHTPLTVRPHSTTDQGGGSGQPLVIQLILDGRVLTQVVSRRLYYATQHAPVTSIPNGSF